MKLTGMTHSTQTPKTISFGPLLSCLHVMLGTEWTIRLSYAIGLLCFGGALLLVELETVQPYLLLTSSIFVITPLVMYAPFKFRFFISSTRFALAPSNRSVALVSLMLCNLMATLWSGIHAHFVGKNVAVVMVICALVFSGLSLCIQSAITGVKKLVLSILALGLCAILVMRFYFPISFLNDPMIFRAFLSVTILLWVSAFIWLRYAKNIAPVSTLFTNPQNCHQDQAWLMNVWSANADDMGKRALMHGMADGLTRRISLHAVLLFGFPVGMLAMQVVLASDSARLFEKPMSLLFLSSYALMMAPIINGDWLTRTRLLWLRMSGDRAALFRFWAKSMLIDKAVSLCLMLGYVLALHLAFELSLFIVIPFVISYIILDILVALIWSYFRIRGWSLSNVTAMNFGITMMLASALFTLARFDLWFWFGLALTTIMFCTLWVTSLIRRRFYRMDWSAVKPLRYGKKG